jgi:hypothetical protein
MSWADRILALVQDGNFLDAIDLARAYYVGEAPGNRIGLPSDDAALQQVVGQKLRELMFASANYTFSEDRLTDQTHITADGRGVDRTSLFEGMVVTCARACVALQDFDFLYEDLYERYNSWCISPIFLTQLEPFVLDSIIQYVPPRITQRIISSHADRGRLDHAERLIWHIDPLCLDIDQVIILCKAHNLWDALIYVYCAGLHDYVSPIVELLGLIRQIHHSRRLSSSIANEEMEPLAPHAYKIFQYLADVLSGLTYPSQTQIKKDEALTAKRAIYNFIFFGRAMMWPPGEGGKLVLTADRDGGKEPTYPYLRLLLRFDSEALLHALDIAFEDSFLNERSNNVSRLVIVKILLEIQSSTDLSSADVTFINIFIARNVPKYPQYLDLVSPTALQSVLVGLASDPDPGTQEDRQLAAEYLLSTYTPHQTDRIVELFLEAKFYRILRSWFRNEGRWSALLKAFIDDPDVHITNLFGDIDEVFKLSKTNHGSAAELVDIVLDAMPQLLDTSLTDTASLVERCLPKYHSKVLRVIGDDAPHKQFVYLRALVEPGLAHQEQSVPLRARSNNLGEDERQRYISLVCQYDRIGVIRALSTFPKESGWARLEQICEDSGIWNAVMWSLDARGQPDEAFDKLRWYHAQIARKLLVQLEARNPDQDEVASLVITSRDLESIAIDICKSHSTEAKTLMPCEEMWFSALRSQIDLVQTVSASQSGHVTSEAMDKVLESLRLTVQNTFTALMSLGSLSQVQLPKLFKRLVDATAATRSVSKASYTEFRAILTGMLDSYRFEEDNLLAAARLIDRDLLAAIDEVSRARNKGWRIVSNKCGACQRVVVGREADTSENDQFVIRASGLIFHKTCLPPS